MFLDYLRRDRDDILPLPVFDQVKRLQCGDNIVTSDACDAANMFDRYISPEFSEHIQQHTCPVASEAHLAEVREGPLWSADTPFLLRQLIRERNQKAPIAFALKWRQRKDARQIVLLCTVFLLGEVASHMMMTALVSLRQYVEEERINIIIECFVIEKKLSYQTKILAVNFIL